MPNSYLDFSSDHNEGGLMRAGGVNNIYLTENDAFSARSVLSP